jgi:signal peptidase II
MAFSLSIISNKVILLFLIGCIIAFLAYLLLKNKNNIYYLSGLFCIILGAISNFIDRLTYGYVIDYIDVRFFTVLNMADMIITLGAFLIILALYFQPKLES